MRRTTLLNALCVMAASFPVKGSNACRALQSERETHYNNVLRITYKRYLAAEEFSELLQLRETLVKAMVVLTVDDELEAEARREGVRRRDLIAVDGGENLVERLGLVRVKAPPEGAAGCLCLNISQLVC